MEPLAGLSGFAFRFRIVSGNSSAIAADGYFADGEVEDYTVSNNALLGDPVPNFTIPSSVCVNEPG